MSEPYKRSRSLRRLQIKVPGGQTKSHYRERKHKLGRCHVTGQTLKGVLRERPDDMKRFSKSKKRPSRPYGGNLSSSAMRDVFKKKTRE
tara:strand:- start:13884 stop:14150 length:267 start_codon:yes stop_codon:yes gene_type:complete